MEKTLCHFKTKEELLLKANRDAGIAFSRDEKKAFMSDYPTLTHIRLTFGNKADELWLLPQIGNLVIFTGARPIDEYQQKHLAALIATEYHYLKITELLLFFYKFSIGEYGHFYGAVDPLTIMAALREFLEYRSQKIRAYEQEEEERRQAEEEKKNPPITYEEYLRRKNAV